MFNISISDVFNNIITNYLFQSVMISLYAQSLMNDITCMCMCIGVCMALQYVKCLFFTTALLSLVYILPWLVMFSILDI